MFPIDIPDLNKIYNKFCFDSTVNQYFKTKNLKMLQIQMNTFAQLWGSTTTGFDDECCYGGAAMTFAYTTVIFEPQVNIYSVYFGEKKAYSVLNPSDNFFTDLKEHRMESVLNAEKNYQTIIE